MFPTENVTFATSCWQADWRNLLLDSDYLRIHQIEHNAFAFQEKLLIINNVEDLKAVEGAAQKKIDEGVLSRYVVAKDVLFDFQLQRSDFNEWQYYNALAPLNAIYEAKGEYLLYLTGDVYLKKRVDWIGKAIRFMKKNPNVKVANLTWNENTREAKRESYRKSWNFFLSKEGFSDQMFLVKTSDFKAPIYGEILSCASHYPRGDVFEKRVFSYMKNRGWERITFRGGSYTHENL